MELSNQQQMILDYLLAYKGRIVSSDKLHNSAGSKGDTSGLKVQVHRLRKWLAHTESGYRIESHRGRGYRLVEASE